MKRRFSLGMIFLMLISIIQLPLHNHTAYADPTIPTIEQGEGTEAKPYIITDASELDAVRGYPEPGTFFVLGNDIDLSEYSNWEPIGDDQDKFTGHFDGAGHTITGLTINRSDANNVALFGCVDGAGKIVNVKLEGVDVTGGMYVAGLVGQNFGTITNSSVSGEVEGVGSYYAGGAVGYNDGVISKSFSSADVAGSYYVGGLAGYNKKSVDNSYATGKVSGNSTYGGLVGRNDNGNIKNSYATGQVETGFAAVGGLVGENLGDGTISSSFYDQSTTEQEDTGKGDPKSTEDLMTESTFIDAEWDLETVWEISEGHYPTLRPLTVAQTYHVTYDANEATDGDVPSDDSDYQDGNTVTVQGNSGNLAKTGYTFAGWTMEADGTGTTYKAGDTFEMGTGDITLYAKWIEAMAGSGSEEEPYIITTANQLDSVRDQPGAFYKLGNDIDLSDYSNWEPIGDDQDKFTGHFNGAGHTITGLTINRPSTKYVGLFGYVDTNGTIENVNLENVHVTGGESSGGLIGRNFGSISRCSVSGSVESNQVNIGGLAGDNSGSIRQSFSNAKVTGTDSTHVGGLVGFANLASNIENSYATGAVDGDGNVGGLIGTNIGQIANSFAAGKVRGVSNTGGLVGANFNTISSSFYDQSTTQQEDPGKGEPKSTEELMTKSTFTDAGWDLETVWEMSDGNYPTLRPLAVAQTYHVTYDANEATDGDVPNDNSDYQDGDTVTVQGNSGNLAKTGHTFAGWNTEADGTGTTYKADVTFEMGTGDITLYAKWFEEMAGSGSEEEPYIITTANQLDSVRDQPGAFYKLGNDIDLSNYSNWEPIGDDQDKFTGHFDGAGHAITGLTINRPNTKYVGLFGFVDTNGTIDNVNLENVHITGGEASGGLIGRNFGSISRCSVSGSVESNQVNIGGLAGDNSGSIRQSFSNAKVTGSGSTYVGGLVGFAYITSAIENSYATGAVDGDGNVGGLVGTNIGQIANSFAAGKVRGVSNTGGLVGAGFTPGTVSSSFYDQTTTEQEDAGKGDPKSTEELMTKSTFTDAGWDFETVWEMSDGNYPTIQPLMTDAEAVANAKDALEIGFEAGDSVEHVTEDITLPATGASGTTISWETSHAAVIGEDGRVTRPSSAEGDKEVTLTATITKGSTTETKIFTLTVRALPEIITELNLVAVTGDREVELNWNNTVTGATYYDVYMTERSGQYDEAPLVTVTNATYTVQNLRNGTTYYFIVQAGSPTGVVAQSNEVSATPQSGGDDDDDNENSNGGGSAPASPVTDNTGVEVLVNGRSVSMGAATASERNGQKVLTISIDQQKLEDRLAAESAGAVVTIPVNVESDVVIGELTGRMVKNMEDRQAVLEIRTEQAIYTLPAGLINIDAIAGQIGQSVALEEIKVQIEIAKPPANMVQVAENAAAKGELTLVVPPLNFTVRGIYEGTTIEVSKFNAYVARSIAIPEGVDPSRITTGVVVEPDGTVRHVPTKVVLIDGKYYAQINSLTNSTYAVVWHPLAFADMTNHWAKNAVNNMGSRMVVSGMDDGLFHPDRDITRAEFAAIVVRGLGLKLESGGSAFADVRTSDWYDAAVQTAYAYGLISGYEDGAFRPNEKITREQAMLIVSKAMVVTGMAGTGGGRSADDILRAFQDGGRASGWAKAGIAASVSAGIVSGRSGDMLVPQAFITRAETATMIRQLLMKSELINP